jgi:hypothetical protein
MVVMNIMGGTARLVFFAITTALLFAFPSQGQLSGARITVTQGRLDTVCGTHNVKLVFMCRNYGYFIDFSEAAPQFRPMANVASAYFPVIAPDGRWITYQTGIEREGPPDNAVKGTIWFRELASAGTPVRVADTAYVPRFTQNTPADTPEIVYATSVQCPSGICYAAGRTLKRKIIARVPQQSQAVFGSGSYYGGLSYDNRYLVSGWPAGTNAFMLDLQDSAAGPAAVHTMRVRKNITNADTAVAVGTCNISRSASRVFTNTMLLYDFGSRAITAAGCYHPILGTWAEHAKLFISRYDAGDLRVFDMPADRPVVPDSLAQSGDAVGKEWFHPEWSNHPYFAVAALRIDRAFDSGGTWVHRDNSESVYLINLRDSVYVKLIESTDTSMASSAHFAYPGVWVDTGAGFTEDAAWLSQTIWERSPQRVITPWQGRRALDLRTMLSCGINLRSVAVYALSGRRLNFLRPAPGVPVPPEKVFCALPEGIYLISVETLSDERLLMRWAKSK